MRPATLTIVAHVTLLSQEAADACQRQSGALASHCVVFLSDGRPGDAHVNSKSEFELYKALDELKTK
jgi:hypothetical protein